MPKEPEPNMESIQPGVIHLPYFASVGGELRFANLVSDGRVLSPGN